MSGWIIEDKPYCTGSMSSNRAKVVMISEDGLLKVTVEITQSVDHDRAITLTQTLHRMVRGDVSLALGILNYMVKKALKL